jgi:hypothetical protein
MIEADKIYLVSGYPKRDVYLILDDANIITVYLTTEKGEIFSIGNKDISELEQFKNEFGPIVPLDISGEAKVRMLINIFHSEENDNN